MSSFPSAWLHLEGGGTIRFQALDGAVAITVAPDKGPQQPGATTAVATPREAAMLAAAIQAAVR